MKTPLYENHKALNAHFVEFGLWEMPLYYSSLREEHDAVRNKAGLFDVSHMGRIAIEGADAEAFVDYIATNRIAGKSNGSATYTTLCSKFGGCVEDTIIYKIDENHFFMVANAANRVKDLLHLNNEAKNFIVSITPCFEEEGILALQGPSAKAILSEIFPVASLPSKPMRFNEIEYKGYKLIIASTGYTGEAGFEMYIPDDLLVELWELLLQKGAPHGLQAAGLGARNTLRLEMGYILYGHELDDTIAPTETLANWSVKFDKNNFLGRERLVELEGSKHKRYSQGIVLLDPGVIRDGYQVFKEDRKIGYVTSGGYSPTLNKSIALVLTDELLEAGESLEVEIHGKMKAAEVVDVPFISRSQTH